MHQHELVVCCMHVVVCMLLLQSGVLVRPERKALSPLLFCIKKLTPLPWVRRTYQLAVLGNILRPRFKSRSSMSLLAGERVHVWSMVAVGALAAVEVRAPNKGGPVTDPESRPYPPTHSPVSKSPLFSARLCPLARPSGPIGRDPFITRLLPLQRNIGRGRAGPTAPCRREANFPGKILAQLMDRL